MIHNCMDPYHICTPKTPFSNPGVVGTAVVTDPPGFLDLGDFVRESSDLNWLDILPAFRDVITTYDGNIYMIPLDGDVHSLFYRIDILKEFDLPVPRTWDEYVEVAKATHGKTYKNTTLNGSCIGRTVNSVGQYYANLVLAPITQTLGTRTGFLFDSENMTPLTGEALAEAIRQLELQAKYGTDDGEFDLSTTCNRQHIFWPLFTLSINTVQHRIRRWWWRRSNLKQYQALPH